MDRRIATAIFVVALAAGSAAVGEARGEAPLRDVHAQASMVDVHGVVLGEFTLEETPHGVLIRGELSGLPPGLHGFHIHERGRCEPPFDSAGGHFAPDAREHGIRNRAGRHRGDLTNLWVSAAGRVRVELLATGVTLVPAAAGLLDVDGSALVIHERADDYATDPAGAAGIRIACGVLR